MRLGRSRRRRVPLPGYDAPSERVGLRLAALESDFWQLRDGEQSAQQHPDTFDMPPRQLRDDLRRLDLVQLIFDIEGEDEDGAVAASVCGCWWPSGSAATTSASLQASQHWSIHPATSTCDAAAFAPEHAVRVEKAEAGARAARHLDREPTLRWPYCDN